jgi:hypothetical protein
MTTFLEKATYLWREIAGRLTVRRDTAPIDSIARLQDFVASRSTYVAQKTLFGYVKARMGTRYPRMFEDDTLMASLNIAKVNVFAACLSDLTIYAVATALHNQPLGNDVRRALAQRCYEMSLQRDAGEPTAQFSAQDQIDQFTRRLDDTDWTHHARQPDNFTVSPRALYRWASVADSLKKYDREIIENSIIFAWREIREDYQRRVDGGAISAELSAADRERTGT